MFGWGNAVASIERISAISLRFFLKLFFELGIEGTLAYWDMWLQQALPFPPVPFAFAKT